ncbi:MAG: SurA N-terminal domain-containing protein [Gammaproteobacteria bacterium]
MLQRIRDSLQSQKWITYVVIGALILVFAAWGAYGIVDLSLGPPNYAAKANGEKIPLKDAQDAWQRQQIQLSRQFAGTEIPAELKSRMQDQMLEAMVSDALLHSHATKLGYRISPDAVHKEVLQLPAFQVEGKYSVEAARYALQTAGLTEEQFEVSLRRELERRQLEQALVVSNFLTPAEMKRVQSLQGEQREVRFISLTPDKFAAKAVTDDAVVDAYYKKNQAKFMTNESVHLTYGELRLDQVATQVVITDKDVQDYYEKNRAVYVQPERRSVRHILIESGTDDAAALKKANEVLAEANSGKDFVELAKKYSQDVGSAQNGGDLGWGQKGNLGLDPAFDEAEFSMKSGEVRGPVKTKFGYHILKLDAIEPEHARTLAEARADIEAQLRKDRAAERFGDVQESLQQKLEQPGAQFDALVKDFNLRTGDVPDYERGKGGGPLDATPELDQVVFSSVVLDEKRVGGPVALGEDRLVIVHAIEHRKPAPKPLAAVREEIVKALREEFGRSEAQSVAEQTRAKLAGGASFDDVAKELGVTAEAARFIGRNDPSVPAPVRTATFDSAKPAVGKTVFSTARLENGGEAVLAISNVRLDPNVTPQLQLPQLREAMGRQGEGDAVAYMEELRRTADVSKNPKAFE